ncbi:hypothetical protein F4861DRAFT_392242 [Xylaria intraflava]|nr:hypothetical protein F4861DRAFT_392242 [Xylaria intraflava]
MPQRPTGKDTYLYNLLPVSVCQCQVSRPALRCGLGISNPMCPHAATLPHTSEGQTCSGEQIPHRKGPSRHKPQVHYSIPHAPSSQSRNLIQHRVQHPMMTRPLRAAVRLPEPTATSICPWGLLWTYRIWRRMHYRISPWARDGPAAIRQAATAWAVWAVWAVCIQQVVGMFLMADVWLITLQVAGLAIGRNAICTETSSRNRVELK